MSLNLYRVAVFVHILAAAVWVGGYVLFTWVAPALRTAGPGGAQAFKLLGLRFRTLSWLAVAALVVTGLVFVGSGWDPLRPVLRDKLGLVALAIALKAAHDLWAAPRAADGRMSRTWAVVLARANLVVLLATVYAATLLRAPR